MMLWACLCGAALTLTTASCDKKTQTSEEPAIVKVEPLTIDRTELLLSSTPGWTNISIKGGIPPYMVSQIPDKLADKLQRLEINKENYLEVYWKGFSDLYHNVRGFAGTYPIKISDSKGSSVVLNLDVENWYSFYTSSYSQSDIKKEGERTWRTPIKILKSWLKRDGNVRPVYFQITTDDFELSTEGAGVAEYLSHKRMDGYQVEVKVSLLKSGACTFRFKDKDTSKIYTFIADFMIVEG